MWLVWKSRQGSKIERGRNEGGIRLRNSRSPSRRFLLLLLLLQAFALILRDRDLPLDDVVSEEFERCVCLYQKGGVLRQKERAKSILLLSLVLAGRDRAEEQSCLSRIFAVTQDVGHVSKRALISSSLSNPRTEELERLFSTDFEDTTRRRFPPSVSDSTSPFSSQTTTQRTRDLVFFSFLLLLYVVPPQRRR